MSRSKTKLALSFAITNLALIAVAAVVWLSRPEAPPLIQGVLLSEPRALDDFELIDHHNRVFSNKHLLGRWHLVSYGFTTCPDVCPTTLSTLGNVANKLGSEGREPLEVLFYSVDHRRDTIAQLASYMPFFHKDFVGLTHLDSSENRHLPFEQGLGIFARLTPIDEKVDEQYTGAYDVAHGVTLFLLNPEGKLQAIFEPGEDELGNKVFNADRVYVDYLQIRRYHDRAQIASITSP